MKTTFMYSEKALPEMIPETDTKTFKEEAICRMKALHLFLSCIQAFKEKDQIQMSLGGFLYDVDEPARMAVEYVKKQGLYPYHVIVSRLRDIGVVYDVLIVSQYPEDWEMERPDFEQEENTLLVYSVGPFPEMGSIGVKNQFSGLVRTF